MTAKIQPTSRSGRPVLATIAAGLRQLEHVSNQTLAELPPLETVLVTELPGEDILNFTGTAQAESATVREVMSQHIRHAAGSRSAVAKLVITWAHTTPEPSTPTA